MVKRAEDRSFHFTYQVTCSYNGRVFYGVHSSDNLADGFTGRGTALYESIKDYGPEQHTFVRLQLYPSRAEAKTAYNKLKANFLINPIRQEDKAFHFVYKTYRFDGKYYIGIHSTDNLDDGYMGSGTYIGRSLKKHGREKHKMEILHQCKNREEAFLREGELVTKELLKDPMCMNKVPGGRTHGDRVYGVTEETRQKLSIASKAAVRTPEWYAKVSAATKGKPKYRTEEGDKAWREKVVGRKQSPEHIAARTAGQLSSEQFKKRYRPFSVDGVVYQNGREAVSALGIPGGTLAYRLKSPNWLNYQYLDTPKDPTVVSPRARGAYA